MLIRSLSGVALLVASAPAQSLTGRVVDHRGTPLGGVPVFACWNSAGHPALGEPQSRTATSASNGDFLIDVPGAQTVYVWAAGAVGSASWVSPVRILGVAGHARLVARLAGPTTKTITGLAAWAANGPFRVRLHECPATGTSLEVAVVGEQVDLPPSPATRFELITAAGDSLAVFDDKSPWTVAPPRTFPIRVVDHAGNPVAAAAVRMQVGTLLAEMPTVDVWGAAVLTAADGRATITVPCSGEPTEAGTLMFLASKPGHIESLTGFHSVSFVDRQPIASPVPNELHFTLPVAPEITVATAMPGLARPGAMLLSWVDGVHIDNRKLQVCRQRCVAVPEHGTVSLPPLPACAVDVNVAVPPLLLPGVPGEPVPVVMPTWQQLNATRGVIGWGAAAPLRISVRHADGSPATSCRLVVADQRLRNATEWPALHRGLDAQGVAHVLIADADPRQLFAIDAAGWQLQEVSGGNAGGQIDLELQPWAEFQGTVVDATNAPVVAARFSVQTTGQPHRADWNNLWMVTLLDSGGGWLPVDAGGGFTVRVAPPLLPTLGVRAAAGRRRFSAMQPLGSVSLPLRLVVPGE